MHTRWTTLGVYFFEMVVPFLIFGNAVMRLWACLLSVFFQLLIVVTGNYAFFNLLTVGLCVTLLDDRYLAWTHLPRDILALEPNLALTLVINLAAAILLLPNVLMLLKLFMRSPIFDLILRWFWHFQLVNSYGLFAVMTVHRNEIILEGSNDGVTWREYEFKWKPGALTDPPWQVAPLQPRLDWQMWFASLSKFRHHPWFHQLITRMLQGSKDVLDLFRKNPFPEQPPKMIRAIVYEYHFSTLKEKSVSGHWWVRKYLGAYAPPFSLRADEE